MNKINDVSFRFKKIRDFYKLNQVDFGKKLGVSRDVISNIEQGRVEPKDLVINHICDIYSINKEWLLHGTGKMIANTETTILDGLQKEFNLDNDDMFIIKNYMQLSKSQRKNFVTLLKAIVNPPDDNKSYAEKMEQVSNELMASEKVTKYKVSTTTNITDNTTKEKIS